MSESQISGIKLPRIAITYCTQCRWMLRAAYFGQELLSTFGTTLGEIALVPATGGIFTVQLIYAPESQSQAMDSRTDNGAKDITLKSVLIWDRKAEGGFPETKVLKQRIRDHLEPGRDLGHSDTPSKHAKKSQVEEMHVPKTTEAGVDSQAGIDLAVNSKAGDEQCTDCG